MLGGFTMASTWLELLILFVLLLVNGAFAAAEIAIVSSKRVTLQQRYNNGDRRAAMVLDLMNQPTRLFSTIQIGITFIGIAAGAFGGATLAVSVSKYLQNYPFLKEYAAALGFAIVVIFVSFLTLIIGELVPKRLAFNAPEQIALIAARPLAIIATVSGPVISILSGATELVLRVLGVKTSNRNEITEEEIRILIKQGAETGLFEEAEHDLVERVLKLDDRRITAIMTPKNKMIWLNTEDSIENNQRKVMENNFTRFLVCNGNLERILGVAHVKELLRNCYGGNPFDIETHLEPVMFLTENLRVLECLLKFKESRESVAVIINEYGSVQGMVTITDFLKAIIGTVSSLDQVAVHATIQRDDGSWLIEGSAPVDRLKEIMQVDLLPGEDRDNFATVAGFVMYYLDRLPREGETFYWDKWRIEIIDMDGLRIDKVLLIRPGEIQLE